jgi:isopenicillin N synthase-like dioxygenase
VILCYGHLADSACIVGDLLARWFNDRLRSTEHRVVSPNPLPDANGVIPDVVPARYAIAWFGHPNRDARVEPLEACCTAENPKKYGPVTAGQHVVERLAYLHKKGKNTDSWTDDMQRDANASNGRALEGQGQGQVAVAA